MSVTNLPAIALRPIVPADVPTLFEFECDPEGNRLAGTKPRDRETFMARWKEVFGDPTVIPRAITSGESMVGCICLFKQEGNDSIGYWIDREHWGKGCATRAIELFLQEVPTRPLRARVAAHNTASIRALQRNGFVITDRCQTAATERFEACERLTLMLQ